MGVLVGAADRVIIQGITGRTGRAAAARMVADGTPLVGGVTPTRAGQTVEGLPVVASVTEARDRMGATASFLSVPPAGVRDAALEAIAAGIRLLVIYTEHVPIHDAMRIRAAAVERDVTVLGPNAAGCVTPGEANLSDLDARNLRSGRVGIVSKSGTLTYEVVDQLVSRGSGLSSVVCLGGDPVVGTDHATILRRFEEDPATDVVVMLGEIGGRSELRGADVVATMQTPVVACIVGHHAPPGKRMGHAGALLSRGDETAPAKSKALEEAGAHVVRSITEVAAAALDKMRDAAAGMRHIGA
jgi:succinyl-CoA synthetase alpha subunit